MQPELLLDRISKKLRVTRKTDFSNTEINCLKQSIKSKH